MQVTWYICDIIISCICEKVCCLRGETFFMFGYKVFVPQFAGFWNYWDQFAIRTLNLVKEFYSFYGDSLGSTYYFTFKSVARWIIICVGKNCYLKKLITPPRVNIVAWKVSYEFFSHSHTNRYFSIGRWYEHAAAVPGAPTSLSRPRRSCHAGWGTNATRAPWSSWCPGPFISSHLCPTASAPPWPLVIPEGARWTHHCACARADLVRVWAASSVCRPPQLLERASCHGNVYFATPKVSL